MRGHVLAGFFRCDVLFLQCKHNVNRMVFVILLQVHKTNFYRAALNDASREKGVSVCLCLFVRLSVRQTRGL